MTQRDAIFPAARAAPPRATASGTAADGRLQDGSSWVAPWALAWRGAAASAPCSERGPSMRRDLMAFAVTFLLAASSALAQEQAGRFVEGGGGLDIYAREWGDPDGPAIVLIHGWSQSSASWELQVESALADEFNLVAYDWRGHGNSEKPADAAAYQSAELNAADLQAVINAFGLDDPVLVGWSYGGIIIGDYLAVSGDAAIAGVVTTGATIGAGTGAPASAVGAAAIETIVPSTDLDLDTQLAGITAFLEACFGTMPTAEVFTEALAINMMTPPPVRAAYLGRVVDHSEAYGALIKPLLVTHGSHDAIVPVEMTEQFMQAKPDAEVSIYEGAGHLPFFDDPARFNEELAVFVRAAQ